jgi:hypothetical protein
LSKIGSIKRERILAEEKLRSEVDMEEQIHKKVRIEESERERVRAEMIHSCGRSRSKKSRK